MLKLLSHINIDKLNTCMCVSVCLSVCEREDKNDAHTLKTREIVPNLSKISNEFCYALCVTRACE